MWWALRWARETAVRTTVLWVEGCPPDVEGRRLQRPILLLHDDDIDGTREGGWIDLQVARDSVLQRGDAAQEAVHRLSPRRVVL